MPSNLLLCSQELQDVTLLHCTRQCSYLPTQPVCTTFSRRPQRRPSTGVSPLFLMTNLLTCCKWSSRHADDTMPFMSLTLIHGISIRTDVFSLCKCCRNKRPLDDLVAIFNVFCKLLSQATLAERLNFHHLKTTSLGTSFHRFAL